MVGLYKDPKGEHVILSTNRTTENNSYASEASTLRTKIKNLEKEIKEKKVHISFTIIVAGQVYELLIHTGLFFSNVGFH